MARILLVITGSIAAYKIPELVRLLKKGRHEVRVVMTKSAMEFVGRLALEVVSEERVYMDEDFMEDGKIAHIKLSRWANIVLIAPASADFIGKMANGIANDLASATILASNKPILIAPAMNGFMYKNKAFQRNLELLKQDGVRIIEPEQDLLVCGEYGYGKMANIVEIFEYTELFLAADKDLWSRFVGKNILINAGGMMENIDPVRFIGNSSSGKQGIAIANNLARLGANVHLVLGISQEIPHQRVSLYRAKNAVEMLSVCEELVTEIAFDIGIFSAAISDYRVKNPRKEKIKKSSDGIGKIEFEENPDVVKAISNGKNPPKFMVGFAAETNEIKENAIKKLNEKGLDIIVANDVSEGIFGEDRNKILVITKDSIKEFPLKQKFGVAIDIINEIAKNDQY